MKIWTEHLTKVYRLGSSKITAVDDVSFGIEEGTFTAIVGRSGSGKTTLLNLIGLNDFPSSGKLFIDNMDIFKLSSRQRRKMRLMHMGFVFQTFNLLPTLTAIENVELPMALAGARQKDQKERAIHLFESLGLKTRLSHRPKELSMGEIQRVAIARALVNDPEILIADEPTGELDSKTAKEIVSLLSEISRNEEKTVVVATHDEKVIDIADRIFMIQDGKLKNKE